MRELRHEVWHWTAPHPEWDPSAPWDEAVSSYAIDDGERLLLFDPQSVPSELVERAGDRQVTIVLTSPWHERSAQGLVEQLGAPVFTPQPDEGSPDIAWLLAGDGGEAHIYAAGDRLPMGIETFPGRQWNDTVLWVESHRLVIPGDSLVDFGSGLEIPEQWVDPKETREDVAQRLRPLLDLPVEDVLPTHGGPTDRAALERALA